jgi:hypothetical protein
MANREGLSAIELVENEDVTLAVLAQTIRVDPAAHCHRLVAAKQVRSVVL